MVARVDRLLTHTVALAGLTALVVAVYVVVVLGLGRTPSDDERTLLLLSMVAAGIAALLYLPARRWLTERANRLVYGERVAPDETLRTFGQRLTRSIPLDELLLQLAESLRKSMVLASAEVWTGQDGHYELTAGVPHRQPAPIAIGAKELPVVARAGVSGGTWLDIWVPQLVGPDGSGVDARRAGRPRRRAARLHRGHPARATASRSPRPRTTVLTELARQVGLALHNVQLDTALQASLDELQLAQRGAAGLAGPHRRRRRRRAAQARAQPPRRRPAAPRGAGRQAAPRPRRGRGRPRRRDGDDRRDQGRRADARSPSCARWPTASSRRCSCRAASPRRCRRPPAGPRCRPRSSSTASAATATRSRRPSTSACSRRCRTPASTPATAATVTVRGRRAPTARCGSRSPTTAPGSTPHGGGAARPRLRQHGRPPGRLRRHARRCASAPGAGTTIAGRSRCRWLIAHVDPRCIAGVSQAGSPPASQRRRTIRRRQLVLVDVGDRRRSCGRRAAGRRGRRSTRGSPSVAGRRR